MTASPPWEEFPEWTALFEAFIANPTIAQIADIPRWSVSDDKKRPVDMDRYEFDRLIDRGASPYKPNTMRTLHEMRVLIPNATNYCFLLDTDDSPICVDIEPTCPALLKSNLCLLPATYRETSRSGNGIHLLLPNDTELVERYPNAKKKIKLQAHDRSHEVLRAHWITFTMNQIETPQGAAADPNILLAPLYATATPSKPISELLAAENIDLTSVPDADKILQILDDGAPYRKTPADFHNDMSRYERGLMVTIARQLLGILAIDQIKRNGHEYTFDEKSALLCRAATERLEHREKHDTLRHGMPYLAFESSNVIAMLEAEQQERKSS